MVFDIGVVPYNPDGWGPSDTPAAPLLPRRDGAAVSPQPSNIPYAPFSRSEKLGRIADWTRNLNYNNPSRSAASTVFDFALDDSALLAAAADDDSTFRLVDGKPPPRPKFGPRWRFQQRPQLPQRRDEEVEAKKREAEKERARRDRLWQNNRRSGPGGNNYYQGGPRRDSPALKSSVDIQPEWTMLDQIPFSTFTKLSYAVPDPPEDLLQCGALEFYDHRATRADQTPDDNIQHRLTPTAHSMAAAAFTAAPAAVFSGSRLLTSTSTSAPPRLNLLLLPRRPSPFTLAAADSHRSSAFLVRASSEETSSSIQTDELLADLKEKWDSLENKSTVFIYGGGAIVAVWLSSIVVGAINSVPLLPKIMELVGLGYTGWFVYRYLLFKSSRKELAADIETLKKKIAGTGE